MDLFGDLPEPGHSSGEWAEGNRAGGNREGQAAAGESSWSLSTDYTVLKMDPSLEFGLIQNDRSINCDHCTRICSNDQCGRWIVQINQQHIRK